MGKGGDGGFDISNALEGGIKGGTAGSMFGPWGTAIGAVVGAGAGGLKENDGTMGKIAKIGDTTMGVASMAKGMGGAEKGGGLAGYESEKLKGLSGEGLPKGAGISMPGDSGYEKWGVDPKKDSLTQTIVGNMQKTGNMLKESGMRFEKDPMMDGIAIPDSAFEIQSQGQPVMPYMQFGTPSAQLMNPRQNSSRRN